MTAVFEEEPETQYTLTLAVNNSAWGETFPAVGDNMYTEGSTVSITAVPADGYRFVSWSGVVADATSATTTVSVTANSTVTAIFEKLPIGKYSLTMTVNQPGWGTTDPPPGASIHDDGSIVTITATPASGYRFVNWTGTVADAGSATTTVTLNANVTVTANFEVISAPQFTLTMAVNQIGWGTTNPPAGSNIYDENTVLTITATPAAGYRFVNWTGDVANANSATTTVTLNANVTVMANFEVISVPQFILTMAVNQSGWGTTNPSVGSHTYDEGKEVTITATPSEGYQFVGWTGDVADASSSTTTVTMTGDKTINANFEKIKYILTMAVNQSGWGTTNPSAGANIYDENTVVTITATPAAGYRFVSWTGDVADSTASTTTVTMDGDKTVTANFEEIQEPITEITMVSIPAGTFQMGDIAGIGFENERPVPM